MPAEQIVIFILGLVVLLVVLFGLSYKKAKPNEAFIITGPKKQKVVKGKAAMVIPFFYRMDRVNLALMQIDIKTESVPTKKYIDVIIDGVSNVAVNSSDEDIIRAGKLFADEGLEGVKKIIKEVVEGNMREIVGKMELEELIQDRDKFADEVNKSVALDMGNMGLEIINFTVQNINDSKDLIRDLGADNVEQIKKGARIAKAEAEKEVQIAQASADEAANKARIDADLLIAEQNTSLKIREAKLLRDAETERATAEAAYAIREAEENLKIREAEENANIAAETKRVELAERKVQVQVQTLDAEIKRKAEADKYALQQKADADLYLRTKEAEAKLAEEQREAEAIKIKAEAKLAEEQRAAEAIMYKAKADLEADLAKAKGIEAIGLAEAEAIQKKAEAMAKMEEAAKLGLLLDSKVLPEMIEAASKPLTQVDSITMFGEGNGAKLTEDIMMTTKKALEGIKGGTGIDLVSFLSGALAPKAIEEVVESTKPKK